MQIRKEDEKKYIILGVSIITVVVIISLIVIWKPVVIKEENTSEEQASIEVKDQEDYIKKYTDNICRLLKENNIEEIYNNYLSEEYKKEKFPTEKSFQTFIENKNINARDLVYINSEKGKIQEDVNMYKVYVENQEKTYKESFLIEESSPNIYNITFNNYIKLLKEPISITNYGVKLDVKNAEYGYDYVKFDVKITNNTSGFITLNSSLQDDFIVMAYNAEIVFPDEKRLNGSDLYLGVGKTYETSLKFSIDPLAHTKISYYTVQNILIEETNKKTKITFKLD